MSQYANLNQKLKNIFQIDRPDLDFGIYRILNARRNEISDYLDNRLKAKVENYLADAKSDVHDSQLESITNQIKDEFGKRAFDEAGNLTNETAIESPLGQQYQELRGHADSSFDQAQVFSHLYTFFSRYYDEGDFISQRRYKGDTYAIPYSGEEVMLHWANKDQYYTKSGEMFSNYRIRFNSIGESDKSILFRLLSADTAKDNQKDNDKNRRFVFLSSPKTLDRIDEDGEEYEEIINPIEISEDGNELTIWFEYAVIDSKAKQDKLNVQAHDDILDNTKVTTAWATLLKHPEPTEKQSDRDLLRKHLDTYTQKNTADYFIHKDLGKFLNNELDFYIKNEVMHLDDVVNSSGFIEIERQLALIKCLRKIGRELIDFLASLENFQKKLWLKKKFVVSSHYCITLDRVDEELYSDIANNPEQWQQWQDLGFKLKDGAISHWGSEAYLQSHPYLMVDTSLFDLSFKAKLLNNIDDLDEQTDGLIINSDNFQALNVLQKKYQEQVQCIYIDPPYNTDASAIIYKNGYKDSSWLSLMNNSFSKSIPLLKNDGNTCIAIDDEEVHNLRKVSEQLFTKNLGVGVVRSNPVGRKTTGRLTPVHEYALFYGKGSNSSLFPLDRITDKQVKRYPHVDDTGRYSWLNFIRTGNNDLRTDSPTMYYPIIVDENDNLRIPKMEYISSDIGYRILEDISENEIVLYPNKLINDVVIEKNWQRGWDRFSKESNEYRVRRTEDIINIDFKARMDAKALPRTWWSDSEYASSNHGALDMKNIFENPLFSYPKSRYLVKDCLKTSGLAIKNATCLDYFAGSGTTAHATISLNREDDGNRKYILVEQGEYFDTVVKPRIQKVVYSEDWKGGKPALLKSKNDESIENPYNGISHCLKVVKLESYEDTLNNLELNRTSAQNDLFADLTPAQQDDYLMHYMLDIESKESLLNVADFTNPFDYQLKITADSAGAYTVQNIDLIDTFNYLIGLKVRNIDYQLDRGFVQVDGHLRTGELVTVFWRDCEQIGYDELDKTLQKLRINALDSEYQQIYVNGDHNINTKLTSTDGNERQLKVRSIEQVFLERMFAE
ncbi:MULTISPECIES: site-specific DNA-methyltransferase [unclassified Psychrobacter]|uniref:site-specific DNA-methyltransferase n=1 Tax=unclassified Psychrobacter TaxID=196806 RepID=UPI000C34E5AC|nr:MULTISPECIES: site-specific DNA-methyltransferase [unclassified Psychrobacter]MBA6243111.1 site-specific DNA-methyltransferase [Psychrobacter sp. Urea-trap-18]MBA6284936.1 site-specific DNA-methyltransferase [Psychrobacter sp. Urea-trap-16]MBA6317036.1 site-specific DNA-methyltransferase [Psychrobacter sp. Urea-trap-20]MBA6334154.1 site-specific DNA-methyltransferase [Psychrobacter sp. Urea-trap-19]PKG61790.1 site-specific DNA-methyltransferase [Psychrobacter sp. Choline-3u-12]